ncbi:MAG: hypothetical protein HY760_00895, partial [Nitrospirae bacterium]|nr:hypothetical protein [Nitrospirota bacterium]
PRAAEAVRMAAGLGTGQNTVRIILAGEGVHLLTDDPAEMADGEILEKFLPVIDEWKIPVYVDQNGGGSLPKGNLSARPVDSEGLAEMMAGGHCFFVF